MEWVKCEDELPPCDGKYYIAQNEQCIRNNVLMGEGWTDYDGYGFIGRNGYLDNVKFWKHHREKKYGKQK